MDCKASEAPIEKTIGPAAIFQAPAAKRQVNQPRNDPTGGQPRASNPRTRKKRSHHGRPFAASKGGPSVPVGPPSPELSDEAASPSAGSSASGGSSAAEQRCAGLPEDEQEIELEVRDWASANEVGDERLHGLLRILRRRLGPAAAAAAARAPASPFAAAPSPCDDHPPPPPPPPTPAACFPAAQPVHPVHPVHPYVVQDSLQGKARDPGVYAGDFVGAGVNMMDKQYSPVDTTALVMFMNIHEVKLPLESEIEFHCFNIRLITDALFSVSFNQLVKSLMAGYVYCIYSSIFIVLKFIISRNFAFAINAQCNGNLIALLETPFIFNVKKCATEMRMSCNLITTDKEFETGLYKAFFALLQEPYQEAFVNNRMPINHQMPVQNQKITTEQYQTKQCASRIFMEQPTMCNTNQSVPIMAKTEPMAPLMVGMAYPYTGVPYHLQPNVNWKN